MTTAVGMCVLLGGQAPSEAARRPRGRVLATPPWTQHLQLCPHLPLPHRRHLDSGGHLPEPGCGWGEAAVRVGPPGCLVPGPGLQGGGSWYLVGSESLRVGDPGQVAPRGALPQCCLSLLGHGLCI